MLIVAFYYIFRAIELSMRKVSAIGATAIVVDPTKRVACLPLKLKMEPRLGMEPPPFPIIISEVFESVAKCEQIPEGEKAEATVVLSILYVLSAQLPFHAPLVPDGTFIDRGPFQSGTFPAREYVLTKLEDAARSIMDTAVVRAILPGEQWSLPKGVSARIAVVSKGTPLIELKSLAGTLRMTKHIHGAHPLAYSQWKRRFAGLPAQASVSTLAYDLSLEFAGVAFFHLRRSTTSQWTPELYLQWLQGLQNWICTYIDWLESDEQIPPEKSFILVDPSPPHYRYELGVIPPGNGHIVFDRPWKART
jgi:hypothetical protein